MNEIQLGGGDVPVSPQPPQSTKPAARPTLKGVSDLNNEDLLDRLVTASASDELIPWEECELPSRGLYYGWSSPIIKVRAWTIKTDKILSTKRILETGKAFDYVFEECCRFPEGFSPSELLVGDQIFLMYYLRGLTFSNLYEFGMNCPACKNRGLYSVDMNELASTIKWANPSLGREPFSIQLPYLSELAGKTVNAEVRFLRVADSQNIARKEQAKRQAIGNLTTVRLGGTAQDNNEPINNALANNLETVIMSILGSSDPIKIHQIVSNMHSRDVSAIMKWLDDNSPGVDVNVNLGCKQCGQEIRVSLPLTPEFFRPKDLQRRRE